MFLAPAPTPDVSTLWSQRFLIVAIVYPILEEIVFRGVLQSWALRQKWGGGRWFGVSSANVAVSIVFTTLHVVRRTGAVSAAVFVPSLIFGYFRERYDGLIVPIALHVFYNAGFVLLFA